MRRTKRLGAVVGLALLLPACWPVPGATPDRTYNNTAEDRLTPATVGDLQELWRWDWGQTGRQRPVLSPGGVHVTVPCGIVTLDPATGSERWAQGVVDDASGWICLDGWGYWEFSAPHVIRSGGEFHVATGAQWVYRSGPPAWREVSQSWGRAFDAETGELSDVPTANYVQAARGDQTAGVNRFPQGFPAPELTLITAAGFRLTRVGPGGASQHGLTLGDDTPAPGCRRSRPGCPVRTVFQAGSGPLSTDPADSAMGAGVRAYAPGYENGCGNNVSCPVWVNPISGALPPMIGQGGDVLFVVSTSTGTLHALDAASGATLWTAAATAA